jgi:glutathione-regulated potassium-efflux system ancillary protein KefC
MTTIWMLAAVWFALAVFASLASSWLRMTTAVVEIMVGVAAGWVFAVLFEPQWLGGGESWVKFVAGAGAMMLTFLAGAELEPSVFREKWKEAGAVGFVSFFVPFVGCTAGAHYLLEWDFRASLIAGIAMSGTSVAVVYSAMLAHGFNRTLYGKTVLAACFITDLGTVLALGAVFAPFDGRTVLFLAVMLVAIPGAMWLTPRLFDRYGYRPDEIEPKFLFLILFGLGALAAWAGSEAILPAYVLGVALAGSVGRDHALIRRLRTLTFGFLTPIFFIYAGTLLSVPMLMAAPVAFLAMLVLKVATKSLGVYPVTRAFGSGQTEATYTTLLMSTGLTFGAISSIFGLNHGIIDQAQYSALIAAIIASAVIPTLFANAFFVPHHLKPESAPPTDAISQNEM